MADSMVPWSLDAVGGAITEPAWKSRASWYLVATDDKMIPADLQRVMSSEFKGSHAIYVPHPEAVAALIEKTSQGL